MKISLNCLRDFIDIKLTAAELEQLLTNCGLEVEHYETYSSVKGGLEGLLTGEVISCTQHPNADRLRLTTVNIGTGTDLNIVCGAPNVAQGQKVIVATIGATLYPSEGEPFKISKSKIRGEVSEGMICAEDEIGLGHSHAGIMVLAPDTPVGRPAAEILPVYTDTIFEIGLTPNRGDAASHLGVARDLKAITRTPIKNWEKEIPAPSAQLPIEIVLEEPALCPRYSGISIKGVQVADSPQWLQNRLKALGLSPINNIVDITNYVMHSIGQPIHAFDAAKINGGKVLIRKAQAGSVFTTLDGKARNMQGHELMICNAHEPMALAGVFGGLHSGITANTTDIFIESAYFNPVAIRKAAKTHGLSTDSSFRFERGTDPNITLAAARLVATLVLELAGGEIASPLLDVYPEPIPDRQLTFSLARFYRLVGQAIPEKEIKEILTQLDIKIKEEQGQEYQLLVPPYRSDVEREVDVAEEILRIYGYNHIAIPSSIRSCISVSEQDQLHKLQNHVADFLSQNGFNETYGFSMVSSANYQEEELKDAVTLLNPLSAELNIMRLSMLYNGLEVIRYNNNRKNANLKIYEFGKTYVLKDGQYLEQKHLSLFISGNVFEGNWNTAASPASFFYLKAFVESLLHKLGINQWEMKAAESLSENYSECLHLMAGKDLLLEFVTVNTSLLKKYDLDNPVYFADCKWDTLSRLATKARFSVTPVSRFPEVKRDLSLLIDKAITFSQLEQIAWQTEKKLLRKVNVFDVYEGNKIPAGKKSYALSFILQDEEKTLTDELIDKTMQKLISNFRQQLQAEIRQ